MPEEYKILRAYVLNEVGDEEREAIEKRLLTDEDFFRQLSLVEEMVVQDYADGKLTAAQRDYFENCFFISDENRQKLRFARALRKYVDETEEDFQKKPSFFDALKSFFLSPVPAAIVVLIIVAVGGFLIWKSSFPANRSESLLALNEAFRAERPFEARITGLDYAEMKNTRGADDGKVNKNKLDLAALTALKAVNENQTAENLHDLGRVYLTEKKFDEAIEQLEKAVRLAPENAKLRNDLGAALMEKARVSDNDRLLNLGKANEAFAKAIELDEKLLDAYFNRALAIKNLNLPNQAREAWQKYLELDSESKWAEEARKNLDALDSAKPLGKTKDEILREFLEAGQTGDREKAWQILSRSRGMYSGKLIPQQLAFLFVDARKNSDPVKSKDCADALRYVAELEEEKSGDLFWKELAQFYSNVPNDKISVLARAQEAVREGYKLLLKQEYKKSLASFYLAKNSFAGSGSETEERISDYWIGYNLFQGNRLTESTRIFENLASLGETKNYKWIAAQGHIRLAYAFVSKNDYAKAIEHGEKALGYTDKTEDFFNRNTSLTIIADNYKNLGQYELSLGFSEKSLQMDALPEASQDQKWSNYRLATGIFQELEFYDSAATFQKEALTVAQSTDNKYNEQVSNVYLTRLNILEKNYDDAEKFARESIRLAKTFPDEEVRQKATAHALIQYGNLKRLTGDYVQAIAVLSEAGSFYDASEFQLDRYNLHKEKLLSYLEVKNDDEIRSEMRIILDIFRANRAKILVEQDRNSFFDNKQDVYDIAAEYEFDKGAYAAAFDYLEESRSRSLLDLQNSMVEITKRENRQEIQLSSTIFEPLKLSQIQAEMPDEVQLLQYTVLTDKVLIWVISKNRLDVAESKISADILKEKISAYVNLISKNIEPDEQRKTASELYRILISPIKNKLEKDKEICLLPDKILFHLPFAALFDEKYFIEEFALFYAPSANVFLVCSKKAKKMKAKTSEVLLSVGNPAFEPGAFEDLQSLPAAEKEVRQIAAYYGDKSFSFTGRDATKENFKKNLPRAEVAHVAAHYVIDDRLPLSSSLILAGKNRDEASLANYEIIGEKLSNLRLIVLSACRTQIEKYYNGEGMIGASRTFLAAGVPLVVASQWEVDSDATALMMTDFHRRRSIEKLSTIEALRQSQIKLLKTEKYDQPYYWAAFITLGGHSKF